MTQQSSAATGRTRTRAPRIARLCRHIRRHDILATLLLIPALAAPAAAQDNRQRIDDRRLQQLTTEVMAEVESMKKLTQVMVDKIFSFSELGFQEVETSKYLVGLLRENGFEVREGIAGMPTAWWATWGSGSPVIAFGSDIDGIPKANQKPGVAWHDPLVEGAPGHGEGHNSGQAVNVTAAIALKKIMQREGMTGTLVLWPGVAEELVGAKAWFVRDGFFSNVDAVFFTHVGNNLNVSWGGGDGTGLVSVEFTFAGESAHSAGAPWRGRSALDAVELMNVGWNFRREHLRTLQRSHYIISDGGDQPNVVPSRASVWYYIREMDYDNIRRNFDIVINMAEGAAKMTDTEVTRRILGTAWPRHFNKPIAEAMYKHIKRVGLPEWSADDQLLARAVQREVGGDTTGLATTLADLGTPPREPQSGGSDDIGDISWTVPTVTLRFPSNIPNLPGHNWSNAIAMATPIAHKGATAGAKVMAMTALEMFARPQVVQAAKDYFNVQTRDTKYTPFITRDDPPAIHLNRGIMAEFKPELQKYYYDETRYATYLEQLGIRYPTVRR
jgi:aminobenzoyl-glutamate utilization protein B